MLQFWENNPQENLGDNGEKFFNTFEMVLCGIQKQHPLLISDLHMLTTFNMTIFLAATVHEREL